jgi:small subunit ribosomal protein S7
MSRRRAAEKRPVLPDPIYKSTVLNKFINEVMVGGKKAVAQKIVYGALDIIKNLNQSDDPLDYFQKSINNVKPSVEVKSRRVGGATYQVPMEVRSSRAQALAFILILSNSRNRNEKTQKQRLANELIDAFENKGNSVKKKEEVHKMAEANRAFAHYRW